MKLIPSPTQLIQPNGQVTLGLFNKPVEQINYGDYDCRTVMNKPASALKRWSGYKRFQYFGVVSDSLIAGCAFADTRWIGLVFVYLFNPKTGEMTETTFRRPLANGLSLCDSPTAGESIFNVGNNHIVMRYADGKKSLQMSLASGIEMDIWLNEDEYQPLSICTQAGRTGWVYAQKAAGVKAHGVINHAGQKYDLTTLQAGAHHDFSAGYMRRETWWNWACFSGKQNDGTAQPIGLNISCGVNETSFSENAVWVNGQPQRLGLAHFEFERGNADSHWQITTDDGRLQLRFEPLGAHCEKIDAGLLASDFSQFFGHFNGHIVLDDGSSLTIEKQLGFVEDQFARW